MGLSIGRSSCSINHTNTGQAQAPVAAPAPNPDPQRWELLSITFHKNAYVLRVRYLDCTNYEGVKLMVYRGKFPGVDNLDSRGLDPHFRPGNESPVARFRPDPQGTELADAVAKMLDTEMDSICRYGVPLQALHEPKPTTKPLTEAEATVVMAARMVEAAQTAADRADIVTALVSRLLRIVEI